MNLQTQAENEAARRTRSKLETHREAIIELRRKHWTHRQIAHWLNERGVPITLSAVHRFCQRTSARRPRSRNAPVPTNWIQSEPISSPPAQTNHPKPVMPYRFNLDL